MISQQIALQPFLVRVAERENMTYNEAIKTAAQGADSIPVEEFLQSREAQGAQDMGKVLRLNGAQAQQIQADLVQEKVDPRMAAVLVNNMAITALALEPGSAVALDGAMRMLMLDDKPLAQSSVKGGQLQITPALQHVASQMDTDVNGLLHQVAEEYKGHPELSPEHKQQLDGNINTASVFRVDSAEVAQLQEQLAQLGVTPYQSDAILSGLVLNAVAYEPSLRPGLEGIFSLQAQAQKPMTESSIQPL